MARCARPYVFSESGKKQANQRLGEVLFMQLL
jgi:hypothetical protein